MNRDEIRDRLGFYRDLGVKDIYKRAPTSAKTANAGQRKTVASGSFNTASGALAKASGSGRGASEPIPAIDAVLLKDAPLPPLQPPGDTLLKIIENIGDCHRCELSKARNKIVFGSGN